MPTLTPKQIHWINHKSDLNIIHYNLEEILFLQKNGSLPDSMAKGPKHNLQRSLKTNGITIRSKGSQYLTEKGLRLLKRTLKEVER